MKDPEPIEGSNGMSVLRDVMDLETGEPRDVVIRSNDEPFWNTHALNSRDAKQRV
jgi:hypothetical protein